MPASPHFPDMTAEQLRALAQTDREAAESARTTEAREALLRLAERLERLAAQREGQPRS
jgi:hypothetical protein